MDEEVVSWLQSMDLDADDPALQAALAKQGINTMAMLRFAASRGLLTEEQLLSDGVQPLPAGMFIEAIAAVSEAQAGESVDGLERRRAEQRLCFFSSLTLKQLSNETTI